MKSLVASGIGPGSKPDAAVATPARRSSKAVRAFRAVPLADIVVPPGGYFQHARRFAA